MQFGPLLAAAGICTALLASGCTSMESTGSAPHVTAPYAEFLAYPARLQRQADGSLLWVAPGADLGKYNKILLERIQVRLADDASYKTVDPTQLKTLTDAFRQAIVKALSPAYPVVNKPGPGVLRVRIALTELVPTKPEVSAVIFFVPYATVADMASGPASGGPVGSAPYLGRTGIAAELIDSQTNQIVAEYADTQVGRKYVVNTSKGMVNAVTTGFTDYAEAFTTWDYANQAFAQWAQQFRRRLDELHGRQVETKAVR
jgi:hypothetical protein